MDDSHCETADDVIDALGGRHAVAALTAAKYTAVCNWKESFPPDLFALMTGALAKRGKRAPARLWRQRTGEAGTARKRGKKNTAKR